MLGLDSVGKTTILYKMNISEIVSIVPTIGFNLDVAEFQNVKFTCWDLGGSDYIRIPRRKYQINIQAFVFVVDASEPERINIAKN